MTQNTSPNVSVQIFMTMLAGSFGGVVADSVMKADYGRAAGALVVTLFWFILGLYWPRLAPRLSTALVSSANLVANDFRSWLIVAGMAFIYFMFTANPNTSQTAVTVQTAAVPAAPALEKAAEPSATSEPSPPAFVGFGPKYLLDLLGNRTEDERAALMALYRGKYMRVTGKTHPGQRNRDNRDSAFLAVDMPPNLGVFCQVGKAQVDMAITVPQDSTVTIAGQIKSVNDMRDLLFLEPCEIEAVK